MFCPLSRICLLFILSFICIYFVFFIWNPCSCWARPLLWNYTPNPAVFIWLSCVCGMNIQYEITASLHTLAHGTVFFAVGTLPYAGLGNICDTTGPLSAPLPYSGITSFHGNVHVLPPSSLATLTWMFPAGSPHFQNQWDSKSQGLSEVHYLEFSPMGFSSSAFQIWKNMRPPHLPGNYRGTWDPNSDFHTCLASTPATEPAPHV